MFRPKLYAFALLQDDENVKNAMILQIIQADLHVLNYALRYEELCTILHAVEWKPLYVGHIFNTLTVHKLYKMQSLSRMKITKEHGPMKCSKQTMV
jgi:hypothetical protein